MRRAAVVLAVLALAGADAAAKTEPLYGLVGTSSRAALVELDPETLRPLPGRRLRLGPVGATASVVRAGDLALADGYRLRLIDLATMKQFASVRVGSGVQAVAWPEWQRIVLLAGGNWIVRLIAVDRSLMKVTRYTLVDGNLIAYERVPTGLVLLVAPKQGIGSARLVIVDSRARTREIPLERIVAGTRLDGSDPPRGESRSPGLAVDAERGVAYVVGADGLVAEIPLSGNPRYHAVRGRYLKTIAGSWRTAEWLGGGKLAVAGADSVDGHSSNPSGVELIDTHSWTSRFVLAGATNVVRWRDGVLATGSPWDDAVGQKPGIGLVAVGRDGHERMRLLEGEPLWIAAVTATRAYVFADGGEAAYVVDLAAGRVVSRHNSVPSFLPVQEPAVWP